MFAAYVKDCDAIPLLTHDEEKALAEEASEASRTHLVRANMRLAVQVAKYYLGFGLELDDLIQAGNIGLIDAANRYNPAYDCRFSTYAVYWIKHHIRTALTYTSRTIKLPQYMLGLLNEYRKAKSQAPHATFASLANKMRLSKKKAACLEKAIALNVIPLSEEIAVSIPEKVSQLADSLTMEEVESALSLVSKLDKRSQTILRMRFGLEGQEPMTLKAIGETMGITRERVRQLEKEALEELRAMLLT